MKFKQYLTEKRKNNIIVVDIQPEYDNFFRFKLYNFCDLLNTNGKVLYFYNGPETVGGSNKNEIINWLIDNGLDYNKISDIKFIDKGYGFFRGWMDNGVDKRTIIKAIRYMVSKKVYDSRDIDEEEWEEKIKGIWNKADCDDNLYLPPEIRVDKLKKWSGSYLCGGGKTACLLEIEILMNAFNIKYKEVKEFIY